MKSELALGNKALKEKKYAQALKHYHAALEKQPELAAMIQGNIKLLEKKMRDRAVSEVAESKGTSKSETIDIVVPVYNALEDVKLCLESLSRHTDGYDVRILVVNDGSDAETTNWLREYCKVNKPFQLIEHSENKGYTCTVNTGLRVSTAEYVITENSDTIVPAGWLTGMVRCIKSDPKIGVVGPLSNAASWQNVPYLRDESGGFAVNELPPEHTVETMAKLVSTVSSRQYPRLPFINGFCFMIRRAVINTIGFMDEENFPIGYGEENDFCIRASDAGFELAVADDVFVYHAKSKSFGHDRRKMLSDQGTQNLKNKHTVEKYLASVEVVKKTEVLDSVRSQIQKAIQQSRLQKDVDLMSMRILFLLPVKGGGGGAHSVVQEVNEMRRIGIDACVAVKQEDVASFIKGYADIAGAKDIFKGFENHSLINLAENYDVVVGTIFTSMKLVKQIVEVIPHILPAYYVQDYEPMFFEEGTAKWQEARESYTLVPNAFLFAKTQWIIDEVKRHHGMIVHKVQPSIDHEVYKPTKRQPDGKLYVTAMIRPNTPRRGAERTMRLLTKLSQRHGHHIHINLFGCESESAEFQILEQGFPYHNHGTLLRPQVAQLLAQSDLFIDLSDYQAFGRTALEAMACGCAVVVPAEGGVHEYAIHNQNSLVVNTLDEPACFDAISELIDTPAALKRLRLAGLSTASRYSLHAAALSECIPLENSLNSWRTLYPKLNKPSIVLLPSLRTDGAPSGSGYVRVVIPYMSKEVMSNWHVSQSESLPTPGSAAAVVIQREAIGKSLADLKSWLPIWKSAGGKLVYEIDDDLLNTEALKQRHYKGNLTEIVEKISFLASHADVLHVSTNHLAECLKPFNRQIRVIPNALDADLWRLATPRKHDEDQFCRHPDGPVLIGYIGTPTHDGDLDLITNAMRTIEVKYGSAVEIEVIGGFQKSHPTFGKRIGLPKNNEYPNFVRWLHERVHWDIGIIPLAETDFNKSKSYLKFLEYAALNMAIVVSDAPAYRTIAKHEKNCLIASKNPDHWIENLSRLIEDQNLRQRLASNSIKEVLLQHTTDIVGQRILSSLAQTMHSHSDLRLSKT